MAMFSSLKMTISKIRHVSYLFMNWTDDLFVAHNEILYSSLYFFSFLFYENFIEKEILKESYTS